MRKTKIVCTLGPASGDIKTIKELIKYGMNAARINFSHGTYESHGKIIKNLIQAREELGIPIALMLDTKGPEIRIKDFSKEQIFLKQGQTFVLTTEDVQGDEKRVSVTYKNLPFDLNRGSRVLLDDGLIELRVKNLTDTEVECEVINGGPLSSKKGVNIPDVYVNLPSLTEKDIEDIKFGIKMGFDYIAASFIRSANDIIKIRKILEENDGSNIDIIAKIENRDGVNNIDEILEVSDGIMVARGDLGVEIPTEEVPLIQKMLIKKANQKGKPVITATQMLDSMVRNPRPTRAEANDVANAIFDGTDAIMLSGETAKGSYPIESVKTMATIAERTENSIDYMKNMSEVQNSIQTNITNAISHATCTTATQLNAACIVTVTRSGSTAKMVSKFRPSSPILGCTPDEQVWRKLSLVWGCVPVKTNIKSTTDEIFAQAIQKSVETGIAKKGDIIVITAGVPVGISGTTNILKVHIVGNVLVKGKGIGQQTVSGTASVIKVVDEAEKYFKKGNILVTYNTDNEFLPYMKKASAIIVENGEEGENNHAAIVGRALDIPVIIGCSNAVDLIRNGTIITVDSKKGLVYNGVPEKKKIIIK
ncbi:pyruvate kinase [Defluviitalea phaphyphila]|uniref:pyruvate kinase n=1 Tax=Defluviitalea phaphyphila TaxID=1473580 RepID=UPI000731C38C|nr:pyruvate kinase [Defluviitalea phaphyphila]